MFLIVSSGVAYQQLHLTRTLFFNAYSNLIQTFVFTPEDIPSVVISRKNQPATQKVDKIIHKTRCDVGGQKLVLTIYRVVNVGGST